MTDLKFTARTNDETAVTVISADLVTGDLLGWLIGDMARAMNVNPADIAWNIERQ